MLLGPSPLCKQFPQQSASVWQMLRFTKLQNIEINPFFFIVASEDKNSTKSKEGEVKFVGQGEKSNENGNILQQRSLEKLEDTQCLSSPEKKRKLAAG